MKRTIRFQLEGEIYEVQVEASGDRLTFEHRGERHTVTLLPELARGAAGVQRAGPAPSAAQAASSAPAVAAAAPLPSTSAARATPPRSPGLLYAPMTGLVKEVKVAVGADVKKGDVVLVMEAMKMDVEISAPATGVVAEIAVRSGQTVESQAPLLVIQAG